MKKNSLPETEEHRLNALYLLNILDGPPEKEFQDIVKLASQICEKPFAAISLLDKERQWFKARIGLDMEQTPRDLALGQYVVRSNSFFEIPDTLADPAFRHHPMVSNEPGLRSYAGAPLRMHDNICIGTLCVMDCKPGALTEIQKEHLAALANNAMKMFLHRNKLEELARSNDLLQSLHRINEGIITSRSDINSVLGKILSVTIRLSGSSLGFIAEQSPLNQEYQILAGVGIDSDRQLPDLLLKDGQNTLKDDFRFVNLKGDDERSIFFLFSPITGKDGKKTGLLGIGRDSKSYSEMEAEFLKPVFSACNTLFEIMKADAEKQNAEQENQKITRQLIKAQAIAKTGSWEYNVKDACTYWSEEQYRIFELPPTSPEQLSVLAVERIDPKDRQKATTLSMDLARKGRPFSFRQRLVFEDGRTKIVKVSGSPVMDDSGELILIEGTCQDITEQRQKALDLQRFFELSPDMLCITNTDGRIIKNSVSFQEILGYPDEDIKGRNLFDFIHPEDIEKTRSGMSMLFSNGKLKSLQNRFLHKNGKEISLEWTAAYDEEIKRIYATAKDITGKAELEELLMQNKIEAEKAKAKDIFLANMSHEIRTPLNAIIGFNEILAQTNLNHDQRKKVEIISTASKTLSVIINDILDLSKLESGKLELDAHPFRIENACKQVIQLHSSRAKSKGIKLFFSYDNEIPELINGDEVRLSQILINLLSNAIKFTEKGHVELKVREAERYGNSTRIVFSVADTGIGIPKEKIKKIFERFSQAETYTTRLYGGTGLGLSIVKSLIELHDGSINVKSRQGEGSVFSFSITYEISGEYENPEPHEELAYSEKTDKLSGIKLLLVEDNEHNQLLATSVLEKFGIQPDIANNGKQAIEKLRENTYNIILMDIQMPIMDGISTTEEIRKQLQLNTPIIACSAHAMSSERKKCLENGMNDYISKPYTEKTLIQTILNFAATIKNTDGQNHIHRQPGEIQPESNNTAKSENPLSDGRKGGRPADWLSKAVVSKIPEDVRILSEALENQDWTAIEFKAHNLISSLAILNKSEGIQLSRKLESASHEKDQEESIVLAKELIQYLSNLKEADKKA
jgi:PAS domain S-box-containing protein